MFKENIKTRHPKMYLIYRYTRSILRCFLTYAEIPIYRFCVCLRKTGVLREDKRFDSIRRFRNIHAGERCFIVATGPSVTESDLMALKNEYTISMNSIINILDRTGFIPTYYMCQDYFAFEKIRKNIHKIDQKSIFIGINNADRFTMNRGIKVRNIKDQHLDQINLYHLDYLYKGLRVFRKHYRFKPQFSSDCSVDIKEGTTVVYSAIQLAKYMGFKEIYILGIDATLGPQMTHVGGPSEFDTTSYVSYTDAEFIVKCQNIAFGYALELLNQSDIKVYNVTRGGNIYTLPRKEFRSVLNM